VRASFGKYDSEDHISCARITRVLLIYYCLFVSDAPYIMHLHDYVDIIFRAVLCLRNISVARQEDNCDAGRKENKRTTHGFIR
jgi:hypothetical protein